LYKVFMRRCYKCKEEKDLTLFANDKKQPSGKAYLCKTCKGKKTSQWIKSNKQFQLKSKLSKYGLKETEFEALIKVQNNSCAICKITFDGSPNIDHCHLTLNIRGLLCRQCNVGLGNFKDSQELLKSALLYLEQQKHNQSSP